jgi:hypothetical protein
MWLLQVLHTVHALHGKEGFAAISGDTATKPLPKFPRWHEQVTKKSVPESV